MEREKSKNRSLIIAILVILSLNLILTAAIFSFFLIAAVADSPKADIESTESQPPVGRAPRSPQS